MQARELERLDKSLESFLSRPTAGLGRSERRHWAGVYVRGLLLDGERKRVEPMASRLGQSDQDLHHFVSHSPWSADLLLEGLALARLPSKRVALGASYLEASEYGEFNPTLASSPHRNACHQFALLTGEDRIPFLEVQGVNFA